MNGTESKINSKNTFIPFKLCFQVPTTTLFVNITGLKIYTMNVQQFNSLRDSCKRTQIYDMILH